MSFKKNSFEFLQVITLLTDLSHSMNLAKSDINNLHLIKNNYSLTTKRLISEIKDLSCKTDKIIEDTKKEITKVKKLDPAIEARNKKQYTEKAKYIKKSWGNLEKKLELTYSFRQQQTELKKVDIMNKKDIKNQFKINAKDITGQKNKKKKLEKPTPVLKPKSSSSAKFKQNSIDVTKSKPKPKPKPAPKPPKRPKI